MTNDEILAHKSAVDAARKEFLKIWDRIKKNSTASDGVMLHVQNLCWNFFLQGKGLTK
jgi:hypothetical protein